MFRLRKNYVSKSNSLCTFHSLPFFVFLSSYLFFFFFFYALMQHCYGKIEPP